MKYLLEEIEKTKEIHVLQFLSSIAIKYGIRRATGKEYLKDWVDGGYITIKKDIIKFEKKPEY